MATKIKDKLFKLKILKTEIGNTRSVLDMVDYLSTQFGINSLSKKFVFPRQRLYGRRLRRTFFRTIVMATG